MTVFAARILQEKYGIPLVTIHTMPLQIKSAYELPKVAGRHFAGLVAYLVKSILLVGRG